MLSLRHKHPGDLRVRYNRRETLSALFFLMPAFMALILFCYYPSIMAIRGSFFSWDGMNSEKYVGLRNYNNLFKNDVFWISIKNVFEWSFGSVLITMCAPLVGALLIFHLNNKKAQYFYRSMFVVPMVVPTVVLVQIWSFIYEPNIGLLNNLLRAIGCETLIHNWLGESRLVIPSLIFIGFPWISGLNMLIYYAGLQAISTDILEYAQIDGCSGIQSIIRIELPLIIGQVKLLLMLAIVNTLQNITIPLLLTGGGPGYDSYVPGLLMYYQAFRSTKFGMAYATATVMFVIIFSLTLLTNRINSKNT